MQVIMSIQYKIEEYMQQTYKRGLYKWLGELTHSLPRHNSDTMSEHPTQEYDSGWTSEEPYILS